MHPGTLCIATCSVVLLTRYRWITELEKIEARARGRNFMDMLVGNNPFRI